MKSRRIVRIRSRDGILEPAQAGGQGGSTRWDGVALIAAVDTLREQIKQLVPGSSFAEGAPLDAEGPGCRIDLGTIWDGLHQLEDAVDRARDAAGNATERNDPDDDDDDGPDDDDDDGSDVGTVARRQRDATAKRVEQIQAQNNSFWEGRSTPSDAEADPQAFLAKPVGEGNDAAERERSRDATRRQRIKNLGTYAHQRRAHDASPAFLGRTAAQTSSLIDQIQTAAALLWKH